MARPDKPTKAREFRLRYRADLQGLILQKSRARDPHALTFDGYQLIDEQTRRVVAGAGNGGRGFAADLDAIEGYLNRPRQKAA